MTPAAEAEIAKAEQSIERYFTAFENGAIPEARCAGRVNALGDRIAELRARRDELQALLDAPAPEAPSDETLVWLREQVEHSTPPPPPRLAKTYGRPRSGRPTTVGGADGV